MSITNTFSCTSLIPSFHTSVTRMSQVRWEYPDSSHQSVSIYPVLSHSLAQVFNPSWLPHRPWKLLGISLRCGLFSNLVYLSFFFSVLSFKMWVLSNDQQGSVTVRDFGGAQRKVLEAENGVRPIGVFVTDSQNTKVTVKWRTPFQNGYFEMVFFSSLTSK